MDQAAREELVALFEKSPSKMVKPADVVAFATNPDTKLHKYFEWDDSKAAEAHRLYQARNLLRVVVIHTEHAPIPVRAYVSIREDRGEGGYRMVGQVLSDEEQLRKYLVDVLRDIESFKIKYQRLTHIAAIADMFEAVARAEEELRRKYSLPARGASFVNQTR